MKKLKDLAKSNYLTIYISVVFTAVFIFMNSQKKKSEIDKPKNPTQYESVDTVIPFGYTLYPIEIENFDALDALVGSYAIVNIYSVNEDKKSKLILQRIKIIRSPKDPRYFAALLKNEGATVISKFPGPFRVAVQNPKKPNAIKQDKIISKRRLIKLEDN